MHSRILARDSLPRYTNAIRVIHCRPEAWRRKGKECRQIAAEERLMSSSTTPRNSMDRYYERVDPELKEIVDRDPVCLYLETTNRCNLLCETCPRTFEDLEPPADMSWDLFTKIVDQFPRIERVVLHGVGEPMMVRNLPRMIRYLKARGTYVLFNTNGTLLNNRKGAELVDAGLDELRVSLDAAEPSVFKMVRGRDMFDRIVANVRAFTERQRKLDLARPKVSLWLTGLKETVTQLPKFVKLAHTLGVPEVYLQRLVYFPEGQGLARAQSSMFESITNDESALIEEAEKLAREMGIRFHASGATEPGASLKRKQSDRPWSLCHRPWTLMYFTAHGRAIPCCIAPFSMRGYDSFTLGDATQQTLREIWNGEKYRDFRRALSSDHPRQCCANCGLRWSL
jgi:MoaA/NifB/PqqE/SkfB family radical SAM enzyme